MVECTFLLEEFPEIQVVNNVGGAASFFCHKFIAKSICHPWLRVVCPCCTLPPPSEKEFHFNLSFCIYHANLNLRALKIYALLDFFSLAERQPALIVQMCFLF